MKLQADEKWILLGASRGLGQAFHQHLTDQDSRQQAQVVSRKSAWSADFSKEDQWEKIWQDLCGQRPDRVIYFAGGGPHGNFASKHWRDHQWAFRVNFEFPAWLLYQMSSEKLQSLKQVCFVGSSVAESKPDPGAASYSAAKHALRGLISSIQQETPPPFDLRLFSPGYMDTQLLPLNAWPRQAPELVKSPQEIAQKLLLWLLQENDAKGHLVIS